jgi:hypothetical protein
MNIKSAVFGMICIKPQSINNIIKRLPYAPDSIYNAIEEMLNDKKIIKIKENGKTRLDIPKNYKSQKIKEFFIKSLSYGIDPEILLRKNVQKVWKAIDYFNDVNDLVKETNLSEKSVRKFLRLFSDADLIIYKKKNPIIATKNKDHPLNVILSLILKENNMKNSIYTPGSTPFEEIITTPDEIERILYDKIDNSLTIKKTGFILKGKKDKISILESVPVKQSIEEIFIKKLRTPEGVEDICIRVLADKKLNYDNLLKHAIEKNMVNPVGCYLDIINDINEQIIPNKVIEKFHENISDKKYEFLKEEKGYKKSGWEEKYEKKWNVELYLDIGAIEHGVRAQ